MDWSNPRGLAALTLRSAGYAVPFLASFALIKVIFLFFGEEGYGDYTFAIGAAIAVRVLFYNILQAIMLRFYPAAREASFGAAGLLVLILITGLLGLLVVGLLTLPSLIDFPAVSWLFAHDTRLILVGCALGAGLGFSSALAEFDNAFLSRARATVMLNLIPVVQILLAYIAFKAGLGLEDYILLTATCLCASALLYGIRYFSDGASAAIKDIPKFPDDLKIKIMSYTWPLTLWAVPTIILKASDRLILGASVDAVTLAAYGVCLMLTERVFSSAFTVLSRLYNPLIFGQLREGCMTSAQKSHKATDQMTFAFFGVIATTVLLYSVFGNELLALTSSDAVAPYHWLLMVLAVSVGLQILAECQVIHGQITNKIAPFLYARIGSAVVFLSLVYLLIPTMGLTGLAIAMFGTSATSVMGNTLAVVSVRQRSSRNRT